MADGEVVGSLHVESTRFGFVEEGYRVKHFRRASGELWDSIVMGLLL